MFLLLTLFGPIFISQAFAQVVINEFCPNCDPEWVELFNLTSDPIDLEGWEISDGNTQSSDDITISGTLYSSTLIQPHGFFVIEHPKGWLNDSSPGDTLKLFDNSTNTDPVDSFSYTSTQADKSYSRFPDGSGNFSANTTSTKGTANQPLPTSTPIPTPSPTPLPTPTPTSKPVNTPTPKPIASPTPTFILSSSTKTLISPKIEENADKDPPSPAVNILGDSDVAATPTPTPVPVIPAKISFPIFVMFGGALLCFIAILIYLYKHFLKASVVK